MLGWEDPNRIHGGLGVASSALAEALQKYTDVSFFFPSSRPLSTIQPQRYQHPVPVRLNAYENKHALYGKSIRKAMAVYDRTVLTEGLGWDPDLVHAHDWMTFQSAGQISALLGIPLVLHVHSLASDRSEHPVGLPYEMEKMWLPKASLVIAVSQYTAQKIQQEYHVPASRIAVLNHGVPPEVSFRSDAFTRKNLILFLGRMTWQKGPWHFIRMAESLLADRNDLKFVMAGDGDIWPEAIRYVARSHIGTDVHLPGHLERKDVFKLLSMANAMVVTSESEPLGLVALEAAHFGVPVILPPNCGAKEHLPQTPVVDPADLDHLTDTVKMLLDDQTKAAAVVKMNQQAVQGQNWDMVVRTLLRIYQEML